MLTNIQLENHITKRRHRIPRLRNCFIGTLAYCLIGTFFSSCDKTDTYYEVLVKQPELIKDYASVYALGDTILIRGRFEPESLKITIGDADAPIIGTEADPLNPQLQRIKVLVSEAMGIGTDRPVRITSSGISIGGPAIEIVEDAKSGLLSKELTVTLITDYPLNVTNIYSRSAAGNMYFLRNRNFHINRMDSTGKTQEVFSPALCKDNDGTPFTLTSVNGSGVDPSETYLYLSLYTEAAADESYHYYRLCRYNLETGEFTVLNKTPYHKDDDMKRTLHDVTPFEGPIASVRMFAATSIYPDSRGNIFFDMNWAITRLDASGNYSYRLKNGKYNLSGDIMPKIFNPETNTYYSSAHTIKLPPGTLHSFNRIQAFDPENEQFYVRGLWYDLRRRLELYDLKVNTMTGLFDKTIGSYSHLVPLFISGSFAVLSGFTYTPNTYFGITSVGDGQVLLLYYQDHSYKDLPNVQMPAWGILDFIEKRGRRYAPGQFDTKGYTMNYGTDQVLAIDAGGMIYMSANNQRYIIKTVYK